MARKTTWPPVPTVRGGVEVLRVCIAGRRRSWALGPAGSAEARAEYLRVVAELEACRTAALAHGTGHAVAGVAAGFLDRCLAEVSPKQYDRARTALAPLLALYGHTAAADFGPLGLETVRARFVQAGRCRRQCNQLAGVVRQAFRWAASRELCGPEVHARLATLAPLRAGRTAARETEPVAAAPLEHVEATLPHLPAVVADMVRLQLLSGMRPGEVCLVRPGDVVRPWKSFGGVAVWLFELGRQHKTAWRGKRRDVVLGPKAQAVLTPYLDRDADAYCFSPREVIQAMRSVGEPRSRAPGLRYRTGAYDRAVLRACDKAGVPRWSPNQLRHAAGTRVEADHGREDARCFLGHSSPSTTAIYAEGTERAGRVAALDG